MDREKLIRGLEVLRRFTLHALFVVGIASAGSFFFAKRLLLLLLKVTGTKVYYFTLPEVFLSMVELSIISGIFFSIPAIFFLFWKNIRPLVKINFVYVLFATLLFYVGSIFCYLFVLKSGITFLLGYASDKVKPMISVERYILFSTAMIFAFGITFETPLFLLLLRRLGIVTYEGLAKKRRYAILFITIFAAVITPTPDVYNMMLLAVPTYMLYEIGLLAIRFSEQKKGNDGTE